MRHAFTKDGGNLGTDGSVAFQFTQTGILSYPPGSDEDAVMEAALEAGAQDVLADDDDGSIEVLTTPEDFESVKEAMAAAGLAPENAEVTMRAENTQSLDKHQAEVMLGMLERLEDLDDVQEVYSNADISADILAEL